MHRAPRSPWPAWLRRFAVGALGVCLVVLCSPSSSAGVRDQSPAVELSPTEPSSLDGEWELRLGEGDEPWREVRVPGTLRYQGVEYDGVVWFRTPFHVSADWGERDAALRVPMTANAYEVHVNGHRIGGRGAIGPSGELLRKDFRASVFRVPASILKRGETNVLSLRLRTFFGNGGVMTSGTLLGPEHMVREQALYQAIRATALASLFAFAGFFHLVLFFGRRREWHQLWFAATCAGLASVTVGINTLGYLISDSPDFNAYLVFLPLLFLPTTVSRFFSRFWGQSDVVWGRATSALAGVGAVWLFSSTMHHPIYPSFESILLPAAIVMLIGTLASSLLRTIRAFRQRQRGAVPILVGIAAYATSGSLELAWALGFIDWHVDSYLGFAVLIGSIVVAIASRFAWLHERAERGERDDLTGCLTRHAFREPLQALCRQHDRDGGELSCILLDLDHFKQLNDEHGHNFGDRVLEGVAQSILGALRSSDIVARWGGEEFLILLPERGVGLGEEIAFRVLNAVRSLSFPELPSVKVTISAGVAARGRFERFDAWFSRADAALYQAKQDGRARIHVAQSPRNERPAGPLALVAPERD